MIKNIILLALSLLFFNAELVMSMDPKDVFLKYRRLSKQEQAAIIEAQVVTLDYPLVDAPAPQRSSTKERKDRIAVQKRMFKSFSQGSRSSSPKR